MTVRDYVIKTLPRMIQAYPNRSSTEFDHYKFEFGNKLFRQTGSAVLSAIYRGLELDLTKDLVCCATSPYRFLSSLDAEPCQKIEIRTKIEDEARGVAPVRNQSSMCIFDSSRGLSFSERYRSRRGQDCQWLHLAPEPGSAGSLR